LERNRKVKTGERNSRPDTGSAWDQAEWRSTAVQSNVGNPACNDSLRNLFVFSRSPNRGATANNGKNTLESWQIPPFPALRGLMVLVGKHEATLAAHMFLFD
jgi:hypothetical protein